jgi:hypothetical protein
MSGALLEVYRFLCVKRRYDLLSGISKKVISLHIADSPGVNVYDSEWKKTFNGNCVAHDPQGLFFEVPD